MLKVVITFKSHTHTSHGLFLKNKIKVEVKPKETQLGVCVCEHLTAAEELFTTAVKQIQPRSVFTSDAVRALY